MAQFSFDIVSDFDRGEMNNAVDQAQRELASRYDLKGTSAAIDWNSDDKTSLTITGDNEFHLESIVDIIRKKLASRGQSQKVLQPQTPTQSNLRMLQTVNLISGLDQDKAKSITKLLRETFPKVKTQIQGDTIRVMSPKKDELQQVMRTLNEHDFDFPLQFNNYR